MRPASRDKHAHGCLFVHPSTPPIPHVGGLIDSPPREVLINAQSATVFGDTAQCTGVGSPAPKDAIIAGCLAVFVEGEPAARLGEVTYGGLVAAGSADVFYATQVTPLGKYAADWLTRYMAQQQDVPFEFAPDGCYGRADVMKEIMRKQFGMELGEVEKIFVAGDLRATALAGGSWGWHVAPSVAGVDALGAPVRYVIDPSLHAGGALTAAEWIETSRGPTGHVMRTWTTPENVYLPTGALESDPIGPERGAPTAKEYGQAKLKEYKSIAKATGLVPPGSSITSPKIPPPHIP
jgi:uncharacterized Zn-binding protein involved in type VI secretion